MDRVGAWVFEEYPETRERPVPQATRGLPDLQARRAP